MGLVQVAAPLLALRKWRPFIYYLRTVLTGHSLNALPFSSEEGGQDMRNLKVLFISLLSFHFSSVFRNVF